MSYIVESLKRFLSDSPSFTDYLSDKNRTYTDSPNYLIYTTSFHHNVNVSAFEQGIRPPPGTHFIDVGCCSGMTGLSLAMRGYPVTFHDFEGLGLAFVRQFAKDNNLNVSVIPYGDELPQHYDIAIALDVLEHTGNHLLFVRWLSQLANKVMIAYPLSSGFHPPYENVLDEWVDDEAIRMVVKDRYRVRYDENPDGRRFLVWETS